MTENSNNSQDGLTFTLGELFDGGGIDVLAAHQLVFWRDGRQEIASTLLLNGKNFVVTPLEPSLVEAFRFPIASDDFGSVDSLVGEIEETLEKYCAELDKDTRLPIAAFILGTWVTDRLPTPPLLNISGALGAGMTLMEVLTCLCRRPLAVRDVSVQELDELPTGLFPTVIATQPSRRSLQNLLGAAASREQSVLRGGRLRSCRHAAVVCTRVPLPAPAYSVQLLPNRTPYCRISDEEAQRLTDHLTPRLLRYRLTQHQLIRSSNFDCPRFAAETRLVGRVLGSALEGAPQLQTRLVAALRAFDEQQKVEHSEQLAAFVVEALLALSQEGKSAAYVEEITQLVNAILLGRNERMELSPKKVGMILRNELGLCAERRAHGYQLTLGTTTRQRLQHLAAAYGVLTLHEAEDGEKVPGDHHLEAAAADPVSDQHELTLSVAVKGQS